MNICMQYFFLITLRFSNTFKVFFLSRFTYKFFLFLFIFVGLLIRMSCPYGSISCMFFISRAVLFLFILFIFLETNFICLYERIKCYLTNIFVLDKKDCYCLISVFPFIILEEKGLSNIMTSEFWKFFDLSDFSISFSIFFFLFFFKFFLSSFLFQSFNLILFFVFFTLVFFNYCFFQISFFVIGVLFYFGLFFTGVLCLFFFILCFVFIFFCLFLSFFNHFFNRSLIGVSFFSKDFLAVEDEDLWISSNLFYFDHRIVESEHLNVPLKVKDVQVFYTLLELFFKFPNTFIDKDYLSFSKNFHQTILGHNPSLYNFDSQIIEPYNKNIVRDNSVSAFDSLPQLLDLTYGPFLQLEFRKSDFLFYRKLFKYLFIYKTTSLVRFRRERRKNYWRRLSKRRKYSKYRVFLDFRSFHGLPESFNINGQTYANSNFAFQHSRSLSYSENGLNLSLSTSQDKLRLLALKFKPFERKSRLESRFLKFFWISLPIYSSQIHRFFFNFFPSITSFGFFPSKIKIWLDKFLNFFILGHKNIIIINTPLANLTFRGLKRGTFTLASGGSLDYKNKEEEISELVRLSNIENRTEDSIESAKQELKKTEKSKEEFKEIRKKGIPGSLNIGPFYDDVFDVLNVNKIGILDDLRRINESKKALFLGERKEKSGKNAQAEESESLQNEKSFFGKGFYSGKKSKKKKYSGKTMGFNQEATEEKRERKRTKRKEQSANIFERYKFFWRQLERKQSRQRKKFENLRDLAGFYEGNSPEHFIIRKRIRYKRYLRRNATRIRALWISRNRFFFPNQYNKSSSLYTKIELLELYKVLEYFYFVLGNDRDLFEATAFSIIVSNLRNRFGAAIVNDLLSTQDHKQASKVSVFLHVKDQTTNDTFQDFEIKDQTDGTTQIKVDSSLENKFSYHPSQPFSESVRLHDSSRIFLSSYMFAYLQNFLVYYKYIGSSQ